MTDTSSLTAGQAREIEKYRQERILTAPPEVLVSMLLDRAIIDLDHAIAEAAPLERSLFIRHAQDVVLELRCALDLSQGEIARNLDDLYAYVERQCLDAFIGRTPEPLRPARTVLEDLRQGWQTLL